MLDIWSWVCQFANSDEWVDSDHSSRVFELASSTPGCSSGNSSTRTIQLRAERVFGPYNDTLVTFSVCIEGFQPSVSPKTLWVSDTCPVSSNNPFLPLLLQLLQEIVSRSPTAPNSTTCPRSQLQKLKPEPIAWIMDSHSPESFSSFFNLVFLTRLFWLCAFDAPSEVGSFYFTSLVSPNLEALTCKHAPVLRAFLTTVGVDTEVCFMRTLGYMLAKWLILREVVGVGLQTIASALPTRSLMFSYATEAHGLWILKGYAPVPAMNLTRSSDHRKFPVMGAKESVLKYVLAHQQLEAVFQLEYSLKFHEGHIQVHARVNNLRFHVVKLGFSNKDEEDEIGFENERHFVSRARVWVGPEVGATYVAALSLGRSTNNGGREVETQRIVKGTFGRANKAPKVKAMARTSTRTKMRNWRWDQDAEGNAAIFDTVLCDSTTGQEVISWQPFSNGGEGNSGSDGLQKRYGGANRPFTKTGGLVFSADGYGETVGWRLNKEMEGSVLKWRIGGQVWLSYWPNHVKSSYFETRVVEWCDEVDLPLIPSK